MINRYCELCCCGVKEMAWVDVQTAFFMEMWEEAGQVLSEAATRGDEIATKLHIMLCLVLLIY